MSDVYLADELEEELERTARSARKPPERPEKIRRISSKRIRAIQNP